MRVNAFNIRNALALLSLGLLAACAADHDPYKPVSSAQLHYCDNNEQIMISIADNARQAALGFHGRTMVLPHIDTRVDAQAFSDGLFTFYYDEEKGGVLERDGFPILTGCKKPS